MTYEINIPTSLLPDPPTLPSSDKPSNPMTKDPSKNASKQPQSKPQETQTRSALQTHARILHLLYYRNKNQHRRAHWWRALGTFRREVLRVCALLEISLDASMVSNVAASTQSQSESQKRLQLSEAQASKLQPSQAHISPVKKQKADPKDPNNEANNNKIPLRTRQRHRLDSIKSQLQLRLQFWVSANLLHKWYAAFSQVIGTTQFSALGMSLIGCLARIVKILGLLDYLPGYFEGVDHEGLLKESLGEGGLEALEKRDIDADHRMVLEEGTKRDKTAEKVSESGIASRTDGGIRTIRERDTRDDEEPHGRGNINKRNGSDVGVVLQREPPMKSQIHGGNAEKKRRHEEAQNDRDERYNDNEGTAANKNEKVTNDTETTKPKPRVHFKPQVKAKESIQNQKPEKEKKKKKRKRGGDDIDALFEGLL